jgi:hypothetical protein
MFSDGGRKRLADLRAIVAMTALPELPELSEPFHFRRRGVSRAPTEGGDLSPWFLRWF